MKVWWIKNKGEKGLGPPDQAMGLVVSILLSLIFIYSTFSLEFVQGQAAYWQTETTDWDDIVQYVSGFNSYFSAHWQLPLLAFDGINYPSGTLATFVDIIPIYALVLKALVPQSFAPFNPFGFWVASCFMMQGIAAWSLTKALQVKSWAFLITLTCLLLSYPALMTRMGHISLMSHWVLLFALVLYIQGHKRKELPAIGWTVLLTSAFYINIYLFVMTSGIYAAAWLASPQKISPRNLLRAILPCIVLGLSLFVTMLPLPPIKVTPEWGFGYYCMNLLSPFFGGGLIEKPYPEVPGQYEGYNYLGLGVILAAMLAVIQRKNSVPSLLLKNKAILVIMLCFAIYSLSNHVYWGANKITVLQYPAFMGPITSQFRASGRFFWPVGYAITLFSLYVLYKQMPPKVFTLMLMSILALQALDLKEIHQKLVKLQNREHQVVLQTQTWDAWLQGRTKHLYFYPKFKCFKEHSHTLLPLMKYAAERRLTLNTGYIARYTPDCNDVAEEIANAPTADAAYVFARIEYPNTDTVNAFFPNDQKPDCQTLDFAIVCRYKKHGDRP